MTTNSLTLKVVLRNRYTVFNMEILRKSPLTGNLNVMDLPVTEEQMRRFEARQGYIQDIFPDLTPSQREFIKTGYTDEDWQAIFGPED